MSVAETGRRQALLKAKCKGLVRARWGDVVDRAAEGTLPGGAALAAGGQAWVLAEDEPRRSLGGSLAWAASKGATDHLHLMAEAETGLLARRANVFARPVTVHRIAGTSLVPAEPAPMDPEPPVDPAAEALAPVLEQAGAEVVVEGGLLRAEMRGLEVARVEVDEDGPRLAVGVGKHDREAQRELRGREQGLDALFEVVRIVAQHRTPEGLGHAAYHLSAERWLRSVVVRRPDLVGAASLHPVPSPVVREDLRQPAPAPAAGVDAAGHSILVVCSVGLDPDLVPAAADAWLADGRKPRLVLCLPEGDDHRVTRDLASALAVPCEVVTVPANWRAL